MLSAIRGKHARLLQRGRVNECLCVSVRGLKKVFLFCDLLVHNVLIKENMYTWQIPKL